MLDLKRQPRFAPRKPRMATFIPTTVLLEDDREIPVHIRNISSGGFMAVSAVGLTEGTRFGISIPGRGIVRAEVRWADEQMFGAKFDSPLALREVAKP